MLTSLRIQGLAVIDSLAIDLAEGFNVITGETGAGKSILIKALGLLLGGKASADTVRHGSEQATIGGEFSLPVDHEALRVLAELGISAEPEAGDAPILIRRQVSAKGKSQAWINDVLVTSSALRQLGATLIDIFGQHENQRLLDASQHLRYLDQFLSDKSIRSVVEQAFQRCMLGIGELAETLDKFQARCKDRDYLSFRFEELQRFDPSAEDYESVVNLCRQADRGHVLKDSLDKVQTCLDQGAGEGEPLSKPLWEAGRILGKANSDAELKALGDLALDLAAKVDDLSYQVGRCAQGIDYDEQELEQAQERLAGYQSLFRKLAVADALALQLEMDRIAAELSFIDSAALTVREQLRAVASHSIQLSDCAAKLTSLRQKAAKSLKKRVETELHELAMTGATLDVEFAPAHRALPSLDIAAFGDDCKDLWAQIADVLSSTGDYGAERAQFMLAANPGEPAFALHKVASGGEVSRVMLALKRALAADAETCVLVFDEIDSGISGKVADIVGRKLKDLANNFQVICISHLPQVAAYASSHFLVHKVGKQSRTESMITRLTPKQSAEEIARLLSGPEINKSSLANAKALIERAQER